MTEDRALPEGFEFKPDGNVRVRVSLEAIDSNGEEQQVVHDITCRGVQIIGCQEDGVITLGAGHLPPEVALAVLAKCIAVHKERLTAKVVGKMIELAGINGLDILQQRGGFDEAFKEVIRETFGDVGDTYED